MHPQVDIKKIREQYFNYSVSTGSADERHVREGLRSIAECLHDAATALSHHFSAAVLSYEGRHLGTYRIASMEHDTLALADTLKAKLKTERKVA
ncbi:hypothetical protein [Variovorax sp. ZT4R33]|uniref:hypothetical protein n=1 Tax=Variovorax sp. ZT4R33 TaxID=3443743 RepID=UPI003F4476A9